MPRRGPRSEPAPNTRISNHNDGPSSGDSPRPATASDGRSRFAAGPCKAWSRPQPIRARRAESRLFRETPQTLRIAFFRPATAFWSEPSQRPRVARSRSYHGDEAAAGGAIGGADDEPGGTGSVVRGSWPLSSCCWSSPGLPDGFGPLPPASWRRRYDAAVNSPGEWARRSPRYGPPGKRPREQRERRKGGAVAAWADRRRAAMGNRLLRSHRDHGGANCHWLSAERWAATMPTSGSIPLKNLKRSLSVERIRGVSVAIMDLYDCIVRVNS